jgi:hypothetical protein
MAGYSCGGCDGEEPAAILITPLNGAETLAIGENCMPVTWCGILAGVIDVPAEALWDACVALKEAIGDAQAAAEAQAAVGATDDAQAAAEAQAAALAADGAKAGDGAAATPRRPVARKTPRPRARH